MIDLILPLAASEDGFSRVWSLLWQGFRWVISCLSTVTVVGQVTLLQILIAALIIELIVSAVFVTFSVNHSSDSYTTTDRRGRTQTKTTSRTHRNANIGGRRS